MNAQSPEPNTHVCCDLSGAAVHLPGPAKFAFNVITRLLQHAACAGRETTRRAARTHEIVVTHVPRSLLQIPHHPPDMAYCSSDSCAPAATRRDTATAVMKLLACQTHRVIADDFGDDDEAQYLVWGNESSATAQEASSLLSQVNWRL